MAGMLDPVTNAAPAQQPPAMPVGVPAPDNSDAAFQALGGAAPGGLSILGAAAAGLGKFLSAAPLTSSAAPAAAPVPASNNTTSADVAAAPVPKAVPVPPGFANPHPTNTLAEHVTRHFGTPMSTFQTREHDPAYMTLEDAIHANRHLTPLDIQASTPLLPPQLNPHDQMVGELQSIAHGERTSALANAKSAQDIIAANNAYWDRVKAIIAPPLNPDAMSNYLATLLRQKATAGGMK